MHQPERDPRARRELDAPVRVRAEAPPAAEAHEPNDHAPSLLGRGATSNRPPTDARGARRDAHRRSWGARQSTASALTVARDARGRWPRRARRTQGPTSTGADGGGGGGGGVVVVVVAVAAGPDGTETGRRSGFTRGRRPRSRRTVVRTRGAAAPRPTSRRRALRASGPQPFRRHLGAHPAASSAEGVAAAWLAHERHHRQAARGNGRHAVAAGPRAGSRQAPPARRRRT